jgi:hypothetical protein
MARGRYAIVPVPLTEPDFGVGASKRYLAQTEKSSISSGYGLPQHALYTDHNIKFWLDVLLGGGSSSPANSAPKISHQQIQRQRPARAALSLETEICCGFPAP